MAKSDGRRRKVRTPCRRCGSKQQVFVARFCAWVCVRFCDTAGLRQVVPEDELFAIEAGSGHVFHKQPKKGERASAT